MIIQILSLWVVLLLIVEQCTTAAIQGNHIVLKLFNSNLFIIETSRDKRCISPTPNVTTNTPYIQILQGCDGCDGIQGPPWPFGPPGKDGINGKDGSNLSFMITIFEIETFTFVIKAVKCTCEVYYKSWMISIYIKYIMVYLFVHNQTWT